MSEEMHMATDPAAATTGRRRRRRCRPLQAAGSDREQRTPAQPQQQQARERATHGGKGGRGRTLKGHAPPHRATMARVRFREHVLLCDARLAVLVAARLQRPRTRMLARTALPLRRARRPRVCAPLRDLPMSLARSAGRGIRRAPSTTADVSQSAHCLTRRLLALIRLIAAVLTGLTQSQVS